MKKSWQFGLEVALICSKDTLNPKAAKKIRLHGAKRLVQILDAIVGHDDSVKVGNKIFKVVSDATETNKAKE